MQDFLKDSFLLVTMKLLRMNLKIPKLFFQNHSSVFFCFFLRFLKWRHETRHLFSTVKVKFPKSVKLSYWSTRFVNSLLKSYKKVFNLIKGFQNAKLNYLQFFNPVQDEHFRGYVWMGRVPKMSPLFKICHKYPAMMKRGTVIPYLKKIQKIYESRNTPPDFC